jgi:predicted PurR-regulated permease PerM
LAAQSSSQNKIGNALFYAILVVVAYLSYLIFAPFLVALAWAAILAIVAYPAYEFLARRWARNRAALVSTIAITLIIIVPTLLVMIAFVRQAVEAVQSVQLGVQAGHYSWISNLWLRIQERFPNAVPESLTDLLHRYAERVATYVAARLGTLLQHTAEFIFHLCVTILAMFYLFRDGDSIVERLRELLPFEPEHRDRMVQQTRDLIFASVTSSLAAAIMHGILGGIAFAIAGVRAPLFWGVMMGFFSFVPVVGSALVWVPISISLITSGHLGRAIFVLIACALIVTVVDNLIRPWLLSGRSQMSGLLIFISILGGIAVFGMLGIVLGPIIVAAAASMLDVYVPHSPDRNTASKAV